MRDHAFQWTEDEWDVLGRLSIDKRVEVAAKAVLFKRSIREQAEVDRLIPQKKVRHEAE